MPQAAQPTSATLHPFPAIRRPMRYERVRAVVQSLQTPGLRAMERAEEAIELTARVRSVETVKHRAIEYLRQPWQLDMLHPGLSEREPFEGVVLCKTMGHVDRTLRRRFDMVTPLNIRAATLAFRYRRRVERRAMAEAA